MAYIGRLAPQGSFGQTLGESLGTGLGYGLQQLAQLKLQELAQRQASGNLSGILQRGGYSPQEADILAHLGSRDPKSLPSVLQLLGAGGGEDASTTGQINKEEITASPDRISAQQQFIEEPSIVSPEKKKRDTFAEKIARGAKAQKAPEKQKSVAQQKHEDAIISTRDNLNEIVEISDNLLNRIDKGVKTGIISSSLGKISPTLLDENTEGFFKDASRLLDLQAEDIKGRPSIYRIKIRERAKPGLEHSETINRDIISKIKKEAQSKLENLGKKYKSIFSDLEEPEFKETITEKVSAPSELQVGQKISKLPSQLPEGALFKKGGKTYVVKNGKLIEKE